MHYDYCFKHCFIPTDLVSLAIFALWSIYGITVKAAYADNASVN